MKIIAAFFSVVFLSALIKESPSIDGVKVGMSVESFLKIVKGKRTVKKEKMSSEGEEYNIYNVYKDGKLMYSVEPECGKTCKVWRISVYTKEFKTGKGIGVGSTLADIKKNYTVTDISTEGEGELAVFVKETEMTFFLDSSKVPPGWWRNRTLKTLNDKILVINRILF